MDATGALARGSGSPLQLGATESGGLSMRLSRSRVLQIGKFYPPHMGGIETHVEALCKSLRDHVDVEVAVANDAWGTTEEVVGRIKVTRLGTITHMASAPIWPALVHRIRRCRVDVGDFALHNYP